MHILAIETTGAHASIAVINENRLVFEERSTETMGHLQNAIPMIGRLLARCGLALKDLTAIAVSEGPGSFTGIRIGMATAKALAQVLELDTVSVPTLQAFALENKDFGRILCPILDARRNQVYAGAYVKEEENRVREVVKAGAYDLHEYLAMLERLPRLDKSTLGQPMSDQLENLTPANKHEGELQPQFLFFGDGVTPYREMISTWHPDAGFAPVERCMQQASSVAVLALDLYQKGMQQRSDTLKPVYLRKAEAERKLEERMALEQTSRE